MHVYTWKGMLHCAMCIVQCAPVCPNMHKSGRECHFVPRATACIRASGRGCYVCTTCYSIIELVAACGVTCYSKIELIAACGCDVTCFSTLYRLRKNSWPCLNTCLLRANICRRTGARPIPVVFYHELSLPQIAVYIPEDSTAFFACPVPLFSF